MRLLFLILFSFIHADPSCASINAEIIGAKDDTLSVRFTIENTDRKKTLVLPGYSLVNNTLISPDWEIRIIRDGVCVFTPSIISGKRNLSSLRKLKIKPGETHSFTVDIILSSLTEDPYSLGLQDGKTKHEEYTVRLVCTWGRKHHINALSSNPVIFRKNTRSYKRSLETLFNPYIGHFSSYSL